MVSIPTASGKTLIAEVIALQKMLERQTKYPSQRSKWGKILYLCPLKALASEKFREFEEDWKSLGFSVGMSRSDIDKPDFQIFRNNLIILTNEKADSLLRLNPKVLDDIHTVISDEIHLINDRTRGITLEFLLTRLMTANSRPLQIIGLSATIRNASQLASWLHADLINSTWRPVQLKEGYYLQENIHFQDGSSRKVVKIPGHDDTTSLTIDMLKEGGQVLIFANSRKSAMTQAEQLSPKIRVIANDSDRQLFSWVQHEFEAHHLDDSFAAKKLHKMLKGGVAFHHAGMAQDQLNFIVDQYNARRIKVICCTPTLAAGVNTPARRVIIKTLYRYEADKGSVLIPVMEYKQMAGRAGRPRYDPYGEVVILGSNPEKLAEIGEEYIKGSVEQITSKLDDPQQFQNQVLSIISGKIVTNETNLFQFLSHTFYFHQTFVDPPEEDLSQEKAGHLYSKNQFGHKKSAKKSQKTVKRPRDHRKGGKGDDPLHLETSFDLSFTSADQLLGRPELNHEIPEPHTKTPSSINSQTDSSMNKQGSKDSSSLLSSKEIEKSEVIAYVPPSNNGIQKITIPPKNLQDLLESTLSSFETKDLITRTDSSTSSKDLKATPFGKVTSQSYLHPQDAILLREDLLYAKLLESNEEIILHPISWLHLLTKLDAFPKYYLRRDDYSMIMSFIDKFSDHLIMEQIWEPRDAEFPAFAQQVKMTMVLWDWISELSASEIAERYNLGMGDIHRLADTAQWLLRGLQRIEHLDGNDQGDSDLFTEFQQLELRLRYGIKASLLAFVELKGVGRIRARKIHQAGYSTQDALKKATISELAKIPLIGDSLARNIHQQLHGTPSKSSQGTSRSVNISVKTRRLRRKSMIDSSQSNNSTLNSIGNSDEITSTDFPMEDLLRSTQKPTKQKSTLDAFVKKKKKKR